MKPRYRHVSDRDSRMASINAWEDQSTCFYIQEITDMNKDLDDGNLDEGSKNRKLFDAKMTHFIIMSVALEGKAFANVADVPGLLMKHFGIQVDLTDMGFSSPKDFLKYYTEAIDHYVEFSTHCEDGDDDGKEKIIFKYPKMKC